MQGKVAIVTGAGQGIGFEICRQLVMQGVHVVLNDHDEHLAREAVKKINWEANAAHRPATAGPEGSGVSSLPSPGSCLAMAGDAADLPFIDAMVAKAVESFGRLDIAIANAGITLFGNFFTYPPESFYRVMQVNLGGTFFLAQAAARQMQQQGGGGRILFTSSVTGHQAHKDLAAYGMSKAALEMLARNLVVELSPYRITVNTVAPGATMTERTAGDASYEKTWSAITPLGRPATTADIAHAALFLVSPQAGHITGQTLVIDGGWTALSPEPF